ncbi:hypothetical protein ABZN20_10160 [Methylococcus sp. ANG]|uniref:hypothetical protein n=1 Tax=Methylococcus sp. ANG TaxID=3231903 RepID=UPI0034583E7E
MDDEDGFYVLTASGQKAWYSTFDLYYRAYRESGLFVLLAGAYVVCRNKGYSPPPYLLDDLHKHFVQLLEADTKAEGLAALSFDNNAKGGPWQGAVAKSELAHQQRIRLAQSMGMFVAGLRKTDPKSDDDESNFFVAFAKVLPAWAKATPKYLRKALRGKR